MVHVPVLLKEVVEGLNLKSGDNVIDATVGGGGHAKEILVKTAPDGKLFGIDADENVLREAEKNLAVFGQRVILQRGNFADLKKIAVEKNFRNIHAALFDLGMSSWELERSGRGFSFRQDEPLDMRFDLAGSVTAADIVNAWYEKDLERIFRNFGQERFARTIAERICRERKIRPIKSTSALVEVIRKSFPHSYRFGKIHFATRVFQALRIAVNDELGNLEKVLPEALDIIEKKGRLAVISFHSLEDRIVKKFFISAQKEGQAEIIAKKPIGASWEEIRKNPRSRSAKLRIMEKLL